jgi:hypothetical protein
MSRDMIGGAIVAAGVWAVFAAGVMGFAPIPPRGYAWVVTGSDMIPSHPTLVRIAPPSEMVSAPAPLPKIEAANARLPQG